MGIEDAIAAAVAAQLQPLRAELARLVAELGDLRRSLPPTLAAVADAAERLGVSQSTIRRLVRTGEIPVVRVGRSVRVDLAALRPLTAAEVTERAHEARKPHPPRGIDRS